MLLCTKYITITEKILPLESYTRNALALAKRKFKLFITEGECKII